jgi:uncharacterized protein (TIGR03435 family)
MPRAFAALSLVALLAAASFAQSTSTPPTFEIADVHTSPRSTSLAMRSVVRDGRYELRNATMVDLIRTAYTIDADKVLGGPNWLEFDRFDVIAKVASKTSQETLKLMLQALLADRFKLVVHNDTKAIPGFVLTLGKGKPKFKEPQPSAKTGCERGLPTPIAAAVAGGQISVPLVNISCHNTTMEAFASSLRGFAADYLTNAVVDSTQLKGSWDFDLKWTSKVLLQFVGPDGVTLFDAIDKQLGLKLEEQKLPTPVIMVDQVNKKPTDNSSDIEAKLPPLPPPEFEVADIKPTMAGAPPTPFGIVLGFQPGGRVNLPRFPLRLAISLAWNLNLRNTEIVGAPKWLDSAIFDIVAKAPDSMVPANGTPPFDDFAPMLQALLKDRFKMKVHYEDQPVTAYTLVTTKPKLKKADPATRTGCKLGNAPVAVSSGPLPLPARLVTCQNITMAQFADQLQIIAGPYVRYPVLDATGLDGAWDFTFTFSAIPPNQLAAGFRGAPPPGLAPGPNVEASDPVGGSSFFDAVEKQLGLKLETQKRSYPVFVIDHIEEKPTDN